MPIKEAQDASCASLACPRKGNAGCGGWHKDNTAFPAWGRQRGGGFAAKKKANPASLRSAAPSKGRGSRGHSLLPMEGGAPKGRRLDGGSGMKKSEGDRLKCAINKSTLSTAGAVPLPQGGRLRNEDAVFPILSFRAKARNLFRLRSGKGCEDSGEREAPCFQRIGRTVFHADSITKENGNGKRKRSLGCARDDETRERLFPFLFNLLRKPTPPRCGRQPLPREGARVYTPSFLWKEVPRRGGGWMGEAVSPTHCLPRGRRGAVSISHSQISIYP